MAHLGDLGQEQLTPAQMADLTGLDVLFIPAGGFFTFTPERAAQYIRELKPKIAIPMHYRTALGGPAQLAAVNTVAAAFGQAGLVVYQPSTVILNPVTVPAETQIWVMEPRSDAVAVNAASFAAGKPVAPGSLVSVFGKFTGAGTGQAQSYPLPRKIADTEVMVDGKAASMFYSSSGQINFQLPAATPIGQTLIEVRVGGQVVTRTSATVVDSAPGLFAAANADGTLNGAASPAKLGTVLVLYGTGQGEVKPAVDDGAAAGGALSSSTLTPLVFLMGKQIPVSFSGLAPGFAGLWQINVSLPADTPTGTDMELRVVNGATSNRLMVSVKP